jgi:hypothetical protein
MGYIYGVGNGADRIGDGNMASEVIQSGNRAVVINQQDGRVWANLYVNARNGIQHADITLQRWTGKTVDGAKRWADRMLKAA